MTGYDGIQEIDFKLSDIDTQIKQKEDTKKSAIIMMVISIFLLWPLLIVGGIMYSSAESSIKALQQQKNELLFQKNIMIQQLEHNYN